MESISIPKLPLLASPSSYSIPVQGLGTAVYPFPASEQSREKEAILSAIKIGYRHFDTAAAYQTEQVLGEAIGEAISLGLIKSRDELFVTSKLWCCDAHPHRVPPAIQNTLKYIYVYFIFNINECHYNC
ncbi:putative oxidoreductase [Rosa chinensis]|uniref:Putative oxidoreductase n=1 Tax=Rosa chinensis TaxID=74649 RepID=A0A2P6R4D0_ROSCH|nr:putative oxidoreductase [Rosa chinensis]